MSEIHFSNVSKSFGEKKVLTDLSFSILSGECFTVLGPSGCGKTVILRLIAGFEVPDAGEIRIGERTVAEGARQYALPPEERRIGVVFQDYAVWPHKTVLENVLYPLQMRKAVKTEADGKARRMVEQVNLHGLEARLPYQLSGGQQQRVALARALVSEPEVMLLDEPLSNLDANLREEMRFEIKELQRKTGATILYVTHDQEVALAISDRIAVMDGEGRFRQVGTPRQVYETAADAFVFRFLGLSNFIPVETAGGRTRIQGGDLDFPAVPPEIGKTGNSHFLAACRPMDVELHRTVGELAGKVQRVTLLGAVVDYRIEVGGVVIRAQLQTEEATAKGLVFMEGEICRLSIKELSWFPGDEPAEEKNA